MEGNPEIAEREPCRIDVLRRTGYFSTESNGHLSEYLPWYRKDPQEMQKWIYDGTWIGGRTAGYLNHCRQSRDEYERLYPEWMEQASDPIGPENRSLEHASYIVEALETGRTYRGHLNVGNTGLITNLPDGCTVELPCYVDGNGINPAWVGELPQVCAAICRASISVQEMAVQAALTGDRDLVKQAVMNDPLTAAVCTTDQIWQMCDEMFEALSPWLPQFNGGGRRWPDLPQPGGGVLRAPRTAGDWLPPSLRPD
jgi:alpha-galactosidase